MNTYDVYISRVESVLLRVEADDEDYAIYLADQYVSLPENEDNINWDMDYNYTFNPVMIKE